MRHRATHDLVVLAKSISEAGDAGDEEFARGVCLSRVKKVHPRVSANGPVVVLSGAVDAREGLLVQQSVQAQLFSLPLQDLHEEHVVVAGEGGLAVDRRHFMLRGGDLVVQHRHGHPQLHHDVPHVTQQRLDLLAWWREVVQVRLLVARWQLANQRASTIHQIRALPIELRLDDEELLLPAQERVDGLGVGADLYVLEQPEALRVHSVVRAEQRRLVVDARAKVRHEGARDAKNFVKHEARGGTVPSREGCGRVRGAQATVGERGAVCLARE
mmetsp:Transcript_63620/g.176963  ORF Transcript_63620/g.176963 Transcript_63620/m.176963 type:complete len:272 (-) Transcript_63620:427-1242(-)